MKDYLMAAIRNLRAGSEFVIYDNNYSTVEWLVLEGTAPTQVEIDAEIVKIKAKEDADKAAAEVAKAELLARLGITAEEAALLLA